MTFTLVALCAPSEALAVLAVLIRERVPHHPAVQAERAAVGGVHFFAFRAPPCSSLVRQLVHFLAFRLPKLRDRATLANPPIT